MQSVDPAKATDIKNRIDHARALYDASQQAEAAQQQIQAKQLQDWVAQQDAVFEREYASKESPATMQKISEAAVELAAEYGIGKQELAALWQSQPLMRSAAFQSMMAD